MKTYKRSLAILLCVVMTLTAAPLSGFVGIELPSLFDFTAKAAEEGEVYSGTCGDNLTWNLDASTGVLNITGMGAMENYSYFSSVPWYSYRSYIKTVNIGNNITGIGVSAFAKCSSLTNVKIGNSVTIIGDRAFSNCSNLTSVTINNFITSIGDCVFFECSNLARVTIGNSVTSIGYGAFQSCTSLTSIEIPESVTNIGDSAFSECINLANVTIGNGVQTIGDSAFSSCNSLSCVYYAGSEDNWNAIDIKSGNEHLTDASIDFNYVESGTCGSNLTYKLYSDGKFVVSGIGGMYNYDYGDQAYIYRDVVTEIIIEDGVTRIGDNAFSLFDKVEKVTIADSVTTIGSRAFEDCKNIKDLFIPNSVIDIKSSAFDGCTSITELVIPDSVKNIGYNAFSGCNSLTNVTIGSGVESIGNDVFYGCTNLSIINVDESNASYSSDESGVLFNKDKTQLIKYPSGNESTSYTIPESVNVINANSFYDSENLVNIVIGENVTDIERYAFCFCESLEGIIIPDSVTAIPEGVFAYCYGIKKVTIGSGVTSIDSAAFSNNVGLAKFEVDIENNFYSSDINGVLFNKDKTELVCYPLGKTETHYSIPAGVQRIAQEAFGGFSNLVIIIIPKSVITVGYSAFSQNYNLAEVYYTGTEEQWNDIEIGFDNNMLTQANIVYNYIPGAIASDKCGENLSWYITDEYELVIEGTGDMNNYTYLGQTPWAEYNDKIVKITVAEGVASIGIGAFYGCNAVKSINFPSTLSNMGLFAFGVCTALEEINVSSNNEWYCSEEGIVYNKDKTVIVRYPAGKNAKKFDIPDSVQIINNEAFSESVNLETVSIPESVKKIDYHAFYGSQALETVEIPASVEIIGNNVFDACYSLEAINVSADNAIYSSADGVLFNKARTELIYYPAAKETTYTIPDGVKTIKENAFLFSNVDTFVVPTSVTEIEAAQCKYGSAAKSVTYVGTKAEWDAIYIDPSEGLNDALINANVSFYVDTVSSCKISIKRPDVKSVNYGDVLMFEAVVNNLPEGAKIVWKLSGDASAKLKIAEDGMSCTVKVTGAGELKVTASVVNEQGVPYQNANGNNIASHKTFTAKAGLREFIMWIFRSLFGATLVYPPETLL